MTTMGWRTLIASVLVVLLGAGPATAQLPPPSAAGADEEGIQLDFSDVELSAVIDTIARLTGKNFIYDDKLRCRVTVISPSRMSIDQAYAVFESVLQVKGFTTVEGPGGAIKVIPIRDAKESSVETVQGRTPSPNRDTFVTRLIPLQNIDAEAITTTLKPLVSKEASMVAYGPTNTIILTDSSANIRRILGILDAIDIDTYKEEIAVMAIEHADANTLADQLSEIFGAETTTTGQAAAPSVRSRRSRRRATTTAGDANDGPQAGRVRIITDARTNSLILLTSRGRLDEIRAMVHRLDVPVRGAGRIHVYYLKNADSEELANTLSSLVSNQPTGGGTAPGGAQAQALRAAVTELAEGVTITADVATNSLVIQASKEGYETLRQVIEKLDIARPQVLVEALIMEVNVTDNSDLGFNGIYRLVRGDTDITLSSVTDTAGDAGTVGLIGSGGTSAAAGLIANAIRQSFTTDENGNPTSNGASIQGFIRASASNADANIISSPHILTSDNEEAEIRIGNNIPIPTSRVESAAGVETGLSTSVNIERQDIGVTLRVTPQITEGETLRLDIFQEITDVTTAINVGAVEDVGVALTNRRVENTVNIADGETVVIGGLISDNYSDTITKIPWLGDIPFLGWAFKTHSRALTKTNLLVFITPHIVRDRTDLERESIRKREEFRRRSSEAVDLSEKERKEDERRRKQAQQLGIPYEPVRSRNPTRARLKVLDRRYPLERMLEIEKLREEKARVAEAAAQAEEAAPDYAVLAGVFVNQAGATDLLNDLLDGGFDGTLVTDQSDGDLTYRILIGPYENLVEAQDAAGVLRSAFGLAPSVVVEEPEP